MAWQYLPDIESDMSVFHRIEDVRAMPAQRFIDLVLRLPAYRGVMRAVLEAAQLEEESEGRSWPSSSSPAGRSDEVRHVPSDNLEALANDPDFAGQLEIQRGG
jgi:hypothetical protein